MMVNIPRMVTILRMINVPRMVIIHRKVTIPKTDTIPKSIANPMMGTIPGMIKIPSLWHRGSLGAAQGQLVGSSGRVMGSLSGERWDFIESVIKGLKLYVPPQYSELPTSVLAYSDPRIVTTFHMVDISRIVTIPRMVPILQTKPRTDAIPYWKYTSAPPLQHSFLLV